MNLVIAIGAALCVPIIVVLTLELEMRVDRWFRRGTVIVASGSDRHHDCSCCRRSW